MGQFARRQLRIDGPPSSAQPIHRQLRSCERACGKMRRVHADHQRPRFWMASESRPHLEHRSPPSRDPCAVGICHLLVSAARILARRIVRIELRNLLSKIKVVEIHDCAPPCKREHWSLSRASLRIILRAMNSL